MAIRGSLHDAGLADVCQLLELGQKTGCLSVSDGSRFGQIYFDTGRIIFATVLNRRDRLGDMLVRDGVIDYATLSSVIEGQAERPHRRIGELLMERGLISRDQLESYIRRQIEEAVFHLLTWRQGTFTFEAGRRPGDRELLVELDTASVLLEGARRMDEWASIRPRIPSLDLCYRVNWFRLSRDRDDLTPIQRQLVPYMDGTRTLEELAESVGLDELEASKAVYDLVQAGLAEQVGPRRGARDGEESEATHRHFNLGLAFYRTAMLDDAAREFRAVLDLQPEHHDARLYLALVALRQDRHKQAFVELKSLMDVAGPRPGAFINLAVGLLRSGRYDRALLSLDEAEALRPDMPMVALLRGAVLLRLGRPDDAAAELARYRSLLPENESPVAPYYHDAALAEALAGRLANAAELVRRGVEEYPSAAALLVLAGAVAQRAGDLVEAEKWYRRAAEANPGMAQPHRNLGDLAAQSGALDAALEHYERAVRLDPELGDEVYARMGNVHYRRNDRERAVRCWRQALRLNPENRGVRTRLQIVANAVS